MSYKQAFDAGLVNANPTLNQVILDSNSIATTPLTIQAGSNTGTSPIFPLTVVGPDKTGLAVKPIEVPQSTLSQIGNIAFFASRGNSPADTTAYRAGDIEVGFAGGDGNWGNEYMQFCVGYSGQPNYGNQPTVPSMLLGNLGMAVTSLSTSGTVYSNIQGLLSNTTPSDITLKKNIVPLEMTIDNLNPISYEWIDEKMGKGVQYGFIAQEIKEIYPSIVGSFKNENKEEKLGIDPVKLIPILTSALKQQSKLIKDLEKRLKFLESK